MDMQVDRYKIPMHRERRAWSQEHLAHAAGLGLRTIQRIEATGVASYESIRSIASVLQMPIADFVKPETRAHAPLNKTLFGKISALIGSAAVAIGVFFATGALAKDVMLNVALDLNGETRTMALLTPDGQDAEIRVDGAIKIVIVPTVQSDGQIMLAAKVYGSSNGVYVLLSAPQIATANRQEAEIRVSSERGEVFGVAITPAVQ